MARRRGWLTPVLTDLWAGIHENPAREEAQQLPDQHGTYRDMSCWVWDSLNHVLLEAHSFTTRSEPETARRQKQ